MLNQCCNPECRKPLHYLREGRVFVFGVKGNGDGSKGDGSQLEHYWLCGSCAQRFGLAQDHEGVHLVKRRPRPREAERERPGPQAMAS